MREAAVTQSVGIGQAPFFAAFALFFPLVSSAYAVALPDYCNSGNVRSITLPVYYDRPDLLDPPTFQYAFKVVPATVDPKTAPTVVALNGGPGDTLIDRAGVPGIPASFNQILTDPRGEGCNPSTSTGDPFPLDAFKTAYLARDVLTMVQWLRQKQNVETLPTELQIQTDFYLLYGVSYGTVHATVLTHIAQQENLPAPYSVILEGIFGHRITWEDFQSGFDAEWQKVLAALPPAVAGKFLTDPLPLGFSAEDWALFMHKTLPLGTIPSKGNILYNFLAPLGSNDANVVALAEEVIRTVMNFYKSLPRPKSLVGPAIWCTEMFGSIRIPALVNGHLVPIGDNLCLEHVPPVELTNPYDAVDWPISSPILIYYFQGQNDPSTTLANATYHFNSQTQTYRIGVVVGAAGHNPLTLSLADRGCAGVIWNAIALVDLNGLGSALTSCNWPYLPAVKGPGQ